MKPASTCASLALDRYAGQDLYPPPLKHAATAKSLSPVSGNGSEFSPNHALWKACHVPHNESVEALQLAAETPLNNSCRAAALASSDAAASKANPLQARLAARTVGKSALVAS